MQGKIKNGSIVFKDIVDSVNNADTYYMISHVIVDDTDFHGFLFSYNTRRLFKVCIIDSGVTVCRFFDELSSGFEFLNEYAKGVAESL